jgi:hypothetical protein
MTPRQRPYFQAHRPTTDGPDRAWQDFVAVIGAIVVLLIIFAATARR